MIRRLIILLLIVGCVFAREYIAIIDFEGIGFTEDNARALTQRLTSEIISLEVYQVLERSEMKRLLEEQKFQYSGCVDMKCAVEIGKMIGAKYMVVGSISLVGSSYAIDARLINVETSESYYSGSYSHRGTIDALLNKGMKSIAYQLCEIDNIELIEKEIITDDVNTKNKSKSDFSNKNIAVGLGFGTIKTFNVVLISYDIRLSSNMAIYPLLGWPTIFGIGLDYQQNYNQNGIVFCASYGVNADFHQEFVFQSAYQWQLFGDEPNYLSIGVGYWAYEFKHDCMATAYNDCAGSEVVENRIIPVISFIRRF